METKSWQELGAVSLEGAEGVATSPIQPCRSLAEALRQYLGVSDENLEAAFYERKSDAINFLYSVISRGKLNATMHKRYLCSASKCLMPGAAFTGLTVEPACKLIWPDNGHTLEDDFRSISLRPLKWPLLPALHYEHIPTEHCLECNVNSFPIPMEIVRLTHSTISPMWHSTKMWQHREHSMLPKRLA